MNGFNQIGICNLRLSTYYTLFFSNSFNKVYSECHSLIRYGIETKKFSPDKLFFEATFWVLYTYIKNRDKRCLSTESYKRIEGLFAQKCPNTDNNCS
jgi:hypothetical protein